MCGNNNNNNKNNNNNNKNNNNNNKNNNNNNNHRTEGRLVSIQIETNNILVSSFELGTLEQVVVQRS